MTYREYKDILNYELYKYSSGSPKNIINRFRIKYLQPNTNCVYMARKMWYLYSKGKIGRLRAKFLYLRIIHKYGCVIYPSIKVGKGFHITHPVGIVMGQCEVGEDFMIYQNCTVGTRIPGAGSPTIQNNVELCANSLIIGNVSVCHDVIIGAYSLVIKDIVESGSYAGNPLKRL